MTLEDPFYVVKDEVFKALNKTRGLYLRWQELSKSPTIPNSPEVEWTCTELRNALRSIEWDLEDLEDTIRIVEKNSSKFKIGNKEICERKTFIIATKKEVEVMKSKMNVNRNRERDGTAREPLLGEEGEEGAGTFAAWGSAPRYSRLASHDSPPPHARPHDQLLALSDGVASLNTVSKQIGLELDDQAVMLDDLNTELENADSKLDSTIKKVAKLLHMNNDRRQWMAIGILMVLLVVVLLLFIYL